MGNFRIETFGQRLATGTVPAVLQPDGTVRVRGVPIFSEVRPTDPAVIEGAREPRDRAWLEGALGRHQARAALGKRPIMTLRHFDDDPERVGTYEFTHLDQADVNPDEEPRWTLFGDKVYEDVAAFEKAKGYDARSPEISPDAPGELAALALLRDREPVGKYPNLLERLEKLEPALATAFAGESFRARCGVAPQRWKGATEVFASTEPLTSPYGVARRMLDGGTIDRPRYDALVGAIRAETFAVKPDHRESMVREAASLMAAGEDKYQAANAVAAHWHCTAAEAMDVVKAAMKLKDGGSYVLKPYDSDDFSAKLGEQFAGAGESNEATQPKEGEMPGPDATTEKKAPASLEERMEAMAAKCFEGMAKKFEAMFSKATSPKEEDEGTGEKAESEGTKAPDAERAKLDEAASARGPADLLPPAVSSARPGMAAIPEIFSTRLDTLEQANLGLKAKVDEFQREKAAVALVATAKRTLADLGHPRVTEAFEARLTRAAVTGGQKGVDALLDDLKLMAGMTERAPETYGAMAPGGALATAQQPADLKRAVETFGARPEKKALVLELFSAYQATPEHFRRNVPFFDVCRGRPDINDGHDGIMADRGGSVGRSA